MLLGCIGGNNKNLFGFAGTAGETFNNAVSGFVSRGIGFNEVPLPTYGHGAESSIEDHSDTPVGTILQLLQEGDQLKSRLGRFGLMKLSQLRPGVNDAMPIDQQIMAWRGHGIDSIEEKLNLGGSLFGFLLALDIRFTTTTFLDTVVLFTHTVFVARLATHVKLLS